MNQAEQLSLLEPSGIGEWNPYYVAYARDHGMTPAAMIEHDKARWVHCMAGFIIWIQARWQEWGRLRGVRGSVSDYLSIDKHSAFGTWLAGGHPTYQDV